MNILKPQIIDPDERAKLARRARNIDTDLAAMIERSVTDRIERAHKLRINIDQTDPVHKQIQSPANSDARIVSGKVAHEAIRLTQDNQSGSDLSHFWCHNGEHEWTREKRRGRPPSNCPTHQS